ncbi:hypothetical protein GDO78_022163 [Eleutherodactylus coqui]|uniref:Uncharacterized protein n=1 Tax=Eleutherodactylus coqui TaxID=57060 RepID=A0A8J6JMV9_ELECQ|nr:hypothetical protein GDO78_022163 [Eleutherodactylus coqui]
MLDLVSLSKKKIFPGSSDQRAALSCVYCNSEGHLVTDLCRPTGERCGRLLMACLYGASHERELLRRLVSACRTLNDCLHYS